MFQNKTALTYCLTLPLLALGCSDRPAKLQDAGPRLSEGYFIADNPNEKEVPLVAIRNIEGRMSSYAFLSFNCEGSVSSSYNRTSYSLSGNPKSLGGPSVLRLDRNCEIESEITVESDDAIQIHIALNKVTQAPYTLKRIEKNTFIQKMNELILLSPQHEADENACLESFGDSCTNLSLNGKNQ